MIYAASVCRCIVTHKQNRCNKTSVRCARNAISVTVFGFDDIYRGDLFDI